MGLLFKNGYAPPILMTVLVSHDPKRKCRAARSHDESVEQKKILVDDETVAGECLKWPSLRARVARDLVTDLNH